MKIKRTFCCLYILGLVITCMAYDWKKWQESLDLAQPEELSFIIKTDTNKLLEAEPLILSCVFTNITNKPRVILPDYDRKDALQCGSIKFTVITVNNSELVYRIFISVYSTVSPDQEITLLPKDSVYLNAILWPDNFWKYSKKSSSKRWQKIGLPHGEYRLTSKINLGTKFYPEPARALYLIADTVDFIVQSVPETEWDNLHTVRSVMMEFFKYAEEMGVSDSARNLAYPVLDKIRKTDSYLALYADFVYIGMLAFDGDKSKLDEGIIEAKEFIKEHRGSILGEEMEYLLVKMLYRKEGKSKEFYKQAQQLMRKYPKNINNLGVKKLLEEK